MNCLLVMKIKWSLDINTGAVERSEAARARSLAGATVGGAVRGLGCPYSRKYRHPDAHIYVNMGTPGCPYLRGVYIFMTPVAMFLVSVVLRRPWASDKMALRVRRVMARAKARVIMVYICDRLCINHPFTAFY